jgi:hypothetical protein
MTLSASQKAAIECVAANARARRDDSIATQQHICRMSDITLEEWRGVRSLIQQSARVALHFHPDRPCADGETVALRLLREGRYRSQYETGISNGGLSAHPGGRRDICEERLFGGAYHTPGAAAAERPKYGALELLRQAAGPSPRFGSCYIVLSREVSRRSTFTHLDSHEDPKDVGTLDELDAVLAAVLRDAFSRECVFGVGNLPVPLLVRRIQNEARLPIGTRGWAAPTRNLDYYIEAQVHGDIDLAADVEALVIDPSFRGTETGETLLSLGKAIGVKPGWHHGYRLEPHEVPRDFRGPTMPSLAERVAPTGFVDAGAIGVAVRALHRDPDAWRDRGSVGEVLQELKLLWHVLVRYGHAVRSLDGGNMAG